MQTTKLENARTTSKQNRRSVNRFKVKAGDKCPDCGEGTMVPDSTCIICDRCAWSPCAG